MSSRFPTSVGFSLETLARHGGLEGPNKDGWGVAYFEGPDTFLLREPSPAAKSGLVKFMEEHGPPSRLVLSHIRLATQGEPVLQNTQPFERELGGRAHVFAHNGNLKNVRATCRLNGRRYKPIGDTDSELAFCCLLERLGELWDGADAAPPIEARLEAVAAFAAWLRPLGPFNFIYSDSDALFVHAHRRKQNGGEIRPPGLHLRVRSCYEEAIDLTSSGVLMSPVEQELVLVASVPLTSEEWLPLGEGEVVAIRDGQVQSRVRSE
jgi:glutamine amidotransferase